MLETYQAWGTYDDSAIVTRELIQEVADEAIGTREVQLPDGSIYDLDGEWPSLEMYPSLSAALGEEITRKHHANISLQSPDGSESRSRPIVALVTANSSKNCGSIRSAINSGAPPL